MLKFWDEIEPCFTDHVIDFMYLSMLYLTVFNEEFFTSHPIWQNELGSVMKFTAWDTNEGSVDGSYCSSVGNAAFNYDLRGTFDTCGETIGWGVTWQNDFGDSNSTTAWSGRIYNYPEDPYIQTS